MKPAAAVVLLGACLLGIVVTGNAQQGSGIRRISRPLPGRYIVVLRGADDPEAVGIETAILRNGRLRHVYRDALRGFAIQLPEPAARALADDPRVDYVEEDGLATVTSVVQSGATWGLDRVDQRALPLDNQYGYSRDGFGVNVYVVDTGIRTTHTEFGGRAFIGGDHMDDDDDGDPYDVGNDDGNASMPDGEDCHGHGTHVAGTIGGATYGVAKNVTLWAHRVLDCSGQGPWSGVIAAVDSITADVTRRPAVVNMSLGGPASTALDSAIQGSIAAGVTYVVAAGNSNVDASIMSPARVVEAITVGATSSNDGRASFSNFGAVLDLFAPGVSIRSAGLSSDIASTTMSGTSMASPHAAGVAALYVDEHPDAPPSVVRDVLVAAATPNVVANAGAGSPNVLLYSSINAAPPPVVDVVTPNGGERLFTAAPYDLKWAAVNADGVTSFDVQASTNNGGTYSDISGCTGLQSTVRHCTWLTPGPVTNSARIRVVARDGVSGLSSDASNGSFTIASGSPFVTISAPNTAVNWGRGSRQQIKWKHNLGASSYVRIEASYDGGATYTEVAPAVKNTASSSGVFDWTVAGPSTSSALIRVAWTGGPATDESDTSFTIAEPYITVTKPSKGTNWGYSTQRSQNWQTNLGPGDRIEILLSVNGAQTFPVVLASGITASVKSTKFVAPALAQQTTSARFQVRWANPPAGFAAATNSPVNFSIQPPFVRVTTPNGGETWVSGTSTTVRWAENLGSLESVALSLSVDDGVSYDIVMAAVTPSDGKHNVVVPSTAVSPTAKVRVNWLKDSAMSDASDGTFHIVSSP